MKIFGISLLVLSASLFANEMCTSLCGSCIDNLQDSTCAKVESLCSCTAVRDSLVQDSIQKAARLAEIRDSLVQDSIRKVAAREASAKKLVQQIQNNCEGEFCAFLISFENDSVSRVQPVKSPVPATRLKFYHKNAAASDTTALLKLSPECQNFCGLCPENPTDSTCIKIDKTCQCSAFAAQEKSLVEKAKADSVQKIEAFLKRSENLELSADSIMAFADSAQSLSLSVTFRNEDFFLIDVRNLSSKAPEQAPDPAAIIALPPDSTKQDSNIVSVTVFTPDSITPEQPKPAENLRHFYAGLSLQAGQIYEHYLFGKELARNESFEGGLGAIFRWYMYPYGSFQFGLGAVYQYSDYDILDREAGVSYHNIVGEIPLSFRFGFPVGLGHAIVPFISTSLNVRKPIYAWTYVWYEKSYSWWKEGYRHESSYEDSRDLNDFYDPEDFEFLNFIGFGVEIFRHVSIEWQLLIMSLRTYDGDNWECYNEGTDTWRLKLDFAF